MNSSVVLNGIYVILGASGNTGSLIADSLLWKGEKVRTMGRDAGRLERFVGKGAEAFTADLSDGAALTKAFSGAAGDDENGCSAEGNRFVHRDVQSHQLRSPHAGAAFDSEHHADFV
jgi:NAD(P)H-binding